MVTMSPPPAKSSSSSYSIPSWPFPLASTSRMSTREVTRIVLVEIEALLEVVVRRAQGDGPDDAAFAGLVDVEAVVEVSRIERAVRPDAGTEHLDPHVSSAALIDLDTVGGVILGRRKTERDLEIPVASLVHAEPVAIRNAVAVVNETASRRPTRRPTHRSHRRESR